MQEGQLTLKFRGGFQNHLIVSEKLMFIRFRIFNHPNYDGSGPNYDFSLLRMKNGFNLPAIANVAPACLPSIATPQNVDVSIIF